MYSSDAPSDAIPISCENSANDALANIGAWPISSWQTSGSGVNMGTLLCRMYCVLRNTRKASDARKSLGERNPAVGYSVKPVRSF